MNRSLKRILLLVLSRGQHRCIYNSLFICFKPFKKFLFVNYKQTTRGKGVYCSLSSQLYKTVSDEVLQLLHSGQATLFDSTNASLAFIYSHLLPIYKTQFQPFCVPCDFRFRFGFCWFLEFFVKRGAALIDFGALTRRKTNTLPVNQKIKKKPNPFDSFVGRNELGYRSVN